MNVDTRTLNTISICSGYGGIELGLREVVPTRTVCYVEIELSAVEILAKRMAEKALDEAPVWTNLRTFDTEPWRGKVDMLTGGFPCQPFSVAGKREQEDDERNLWPDVARLIRGLGIPEFVFLENVSGILRYYWDTIRPELREMGYEVTEGLFTASETGAPHRRERLFILAHRMADTAGKGLQGPEHRIPGDAAQPGAELGNTDIEGLEGRDIGRDSGGERPARETSTEFRYPLYPPGPGDRDGWDRLLRQYPDLAPTYCKEGHGVQPEVQKTQSCIRRTPDGPLSGVDLRLRAIGNGVVPAVAALAFRTLARELKIEGLLKN